MSSALCDGVRGALPPVPALIPITVLRPCGGTQSSSSSPTSSSCSVTTEDDTVINNNNNNEDDKIGGSIINNNNNINCVSNSISNHCSSDSQTSNGSDKIVNNTTTQRSSFGYSVVRGGAASEHSISGGVSGGVGRQQRTRRSTQQTVHHTTIDPCIPSSRDRSNSEQAPTRRSSRPERHRKSDRRRCGHRTDRQKCTTTCSRSHSSVRRKITNRASDKSDSQPTTTVPRVNPIFLWVKQEDTRIVEVRCEDYDKRNRIRLTKTAQGWRAIPRTETLLPASVTPVLSDPKPTDTIESKQNTKQKNKTKSRKSSKSKRKSIERFCDDADDNNEASTATHLIQNNNNNNNTVGQQQQQQHNPEIEALTVTREETSSPAWSAPVNIESHLPSHTITIPRKKLLLDGPDSKLVVAEEPTSVTTTTSSSSICSGGGSGVVVGNNNNNNNTDDDAASSSSISNNSVVRSEGNECCVNSADCSAPPPLSTSSTSAPVIPPPQPPSLDPNSVGSCDVTPLDNLLAVAEFEFNHQVHSENQQQLHHHHHRQHQENDAIIELDSSSSDGVGEDNDDDVDRQQIIQQSSPVNDNNINEDIDEIIEEDFDDDLQDHMVITQSDNTDKHDDNEMDTTNYETNGDNDLIVETNDNIETLTDLSEQHKEFFENIVQLNKLIESRTVENTGAKISNSIPTEQSKDAASSTNNSNNTERQSTDECDYNEDDDNNLAMDDIITRLEQSLQSPEQTTSTTCCTTTDMEQLCAEASDFIPITNDDETSEKIEEINDKSNNDEEDDDVTYINDEEDEHHVDDEMKNEAVKLVCENQCDEDGENEDDVVVAVDDNSITTPTTKEDNVSENAVTQENKITSLEILDSTTTAFDEKSTVESIIDDDMDEEQEVDNDEQPTDLSTTNKQNVIEDVQDDFEDDDDVEFEENTEDLPTDLSIPKHVNPTPPLRVETPRPPSHSSETIQSPQPSGIPAVPPSPDIFFANSNQKNKSLFLETLLSSSSPKLCLTPEVTITRQQKEPLDLGKNRKSASPTVTCSEEVKNDNFKYNNNEGEPNAKRLKIEDITLKNLLHKTKNEAKIAKEKSDFTSEKDSSRLLHLLTTDTDLDPVIQFKQLLADDINIPDPLLVPKNRLNQILMAPGVEIPRLLTERPELRLPDALAFPQLLQNPDILVISIAQLQIILQKHSETIKLHETPPPAKPEKVKPTPPVVQKPIEIQEKSVPTQSSANADFAAQYAAAKSAAAAVLPPHITASGLFDAHMKPTSLTKPTKDTSNSNSRLTTSGLAGDIDAATTAAFNQMLWLPYLNQLEAAAVACGNNTDFLKALNAVFPPTLPPFDPNQMFPNFGLHNNFPPASMDYSNQLEMAMWQEAMMKANMAAAQSTPQPTPQQTNRSKNVIDNNYSSMSKSFYRENNNNNNNNSSSNSSNNPSNNNLYNMESRNSHSLSNKKNSGASQQSMQQSKSTHHHTSARTSPITHNFNQHQTQRFPPSAGVPDTATVPTNPYLNNISSTYPFNHNLQIPHYNPSLSQWNAATAAAATTKQSQQHSSRSNNNSSTLSKSTPSVPNYQNYNNLMTSKNDYLKYQQNILNAYNQRSKQEERKLSSKSSKVMNDSVTSNVSHLQQKPRVTCKSLQNLLSPSRLSSQDLTAVSSKKSSSSNHNEVTSIRNTLPSSTSITRLTTQPMDLSGGKHELHHQPHHPMLHSSGGGHHHHHHHSSSGSKLKVKQHLVDSMRTPKLLKHDEIPEVGSTTSSLEEMSSTQLQDAQNHLWHPLFGK